LAPPARHRELRRVGRVAGGSVVADNFQAPFSSERFKANVVSAMQKKEILGVTSRDIIISEKK